MATRSQAPSTIPAEAVTPEPVPYVAEQQPTAAYPDEPVETPPSPVDEESGDDSDHFPAADTPADLPARLTLTVEEAAATLGISPAFAYEDEQIAISRDECIDTSGSGKGDEELVVLVAHGPDSRWRRVVGHLGDLPYRCHELLRLALGERVGEPGSAENFREFIEKPLGYDHRPVPRISSGKDPPTHATRGASRRDEHVGIEDRPEPCAHPAARLRRARRTACASFTANSLEERGLPVLQTEIPLLEAHGWGYGMVPPEGHRYGQLLDELIAAREVVA